MSRNPYAMNVFVEQVKALRKSAKFTYGEPDGLDVNRQLTLDKPTSKWLGNALDHIEDNRLIGWAEDKGEVKIFFSHRNIADLKDPFPIAEAVEVAEDEKN